MLLETYDVIILGVRERVSANVIARARQIRTRVIGSLSIGLDHLDLAALDRNDIRIVNTPLANVQSVAEHNLALVFSLAKRLKAGDRASASKSGRSGLGQLPTELCGKSAGLIGYGKIGHATARLLRGVGMQVFATSRSQLSGADKLAKFVSLDVILAECAFILLALPLTAETQQLLGRARIEGLQRHQYLINTCRPGLVDNQAVLEQLQSGALGGFAADYDEDLWGLAQHANALLTPHVAGITAEASTRMDNELIDRLAQILAT